MPSLPAPAQIASRAFARTRIEATETSSATTAPR
jgi:hypothetical protein